MLESSFGLCFFLKTPKNKSSIRYIYLRVTVDGVPKETSTKRKWDIQRWDQKTERATGNKEDARAINHFLDAITTRINQFKMDLMYNEKSISVQRIIDFVLGRIISKAMLLEEFKSIMTKCWHWFHRIMLWQHINAMRQQDFMQKNL
jgi:hypothetical protein